MKLVTAFQALLIGDTTRNLSISDRLSELEYVENTGAHMKVFVFSIACILFAGCATAKKFEERNLVYEDIKVSDAILPWVHAFEERQRDARLSGPNPQHGYFECRKTAEIKETYFCLYSDQSAMNYALGRATCYIEGAFCNSPKGTLLSTNEKNFLASVRQTLGHDLRGVALVEFYETLKRKCDQNSRSGFCPTPQESELFERIIVPSVLRNKDFIIVAAAHLGRGNFVGTFSHEVLHAQYFNEEKYRKVVDEFWDRELSEKEKTIIRDALSVAYDKSDEFLIKNEFQAYILEAGASTALLSKLVPSFRSRLMAALKKAGTQPIQVVLVKP